MSDPNTTLIQRGSKIGRFVVEEQLGAGGMGLVFAAHDRQLDRRVALKVLRTPEEGDGDETHRMRLLREGQAMARVIHENVITVHEVGVEGKLVFLAQELLDGGTLGQWLRGKRAQREILDKFLAAGRGLSAAHAAGLVHRDFKPDNVLLGKDGRVRVADFGLARALEVLEQETRTGRVEPYGDTRAEHSPMAPLTRTGAVMGTPLYMAPEQHEGKPADERSDQFSFCVALYQALYGAAPFAGKTAVALADNVLNGRLEPPTKGSHVPARLRRILMRGLSVAPAERFPSMEALLAELGRGPSRKLARIALGVGLVAVLGGAVVGGYALRSRDDGGTVAISGRRTLAVLGFRNSGGDPQVAWMSSALSELIAAHLASDELRVTAPDEAYLARFELALPDAEALPPATLGKVRTRLGVEVVIVGAFRRSGNDVTLAASVEDLFRGSTKRVEAKGTASDLPGLAGRLGGEIRAALGLAGPTRTIAGGVVIPRDAQAARAYVEGVEALRAFELEAAEQRLVAATRREPDFAPAHLALAQAHRAQLALEPARAAAREAVASASSLPDEQQQLVIGTAYTLLDEPARARAALAPLFASHRGVLVYGLALARVQDGEEQAATFAALRALAAPDGDDPRIDQLEGQVALRAGKAVRALELARRATDRARARGAKHTLAETRALEGEVLLAQGELAAAGTALDEARTLFEGAGDKRDVIHTTELLGQVGFERGRLDDAIERYTAAARLEEKAGMPAQAIVNRGRVALARVLEGKLAEAEQALAALAGNTGNPLTGSYVELAAGMLAAARGESTGALERAQRCLDSTVADNHARCLQLRGELLAEQGDARGARKAYEEALALAEQTGASKVTIELALAQLDLDEGKVASAAERASALLAGAETRGADALHVHASILRARVKIGADEPLEAFHLLEKLDVDGLPFRVRLLHAITFGKAAVLNGDAEAGYDLIEKARAEAEKAGWRSLVFEARLARAESIGVKDVAAGKLDATDLVHEARQVGMTRYVQLVDKIGRD